MNLAYPLVLFVFAVIIYVLGKVVKDDNEVKKE
jgi:hypothetical protein